MTKDISVSISVYGSFDINRLEMTVMGIQQQVGCSPQIIVAEENPEPRLQDMAKQYGFKHIFTEAKTVDGVARYNPGAIRNNALNQVETDLVYLNDADVIFKNTEYLKELISELREGEALIHPPSRRLVREDVPHFIECTKEEGIASSLTALYHPNDYIATIDGRDIELKVVTHKSNGRVFTTPMTMFEKYRADDSLKGLEPTFWFDIIHVGGIFTHTAMVNEVGNYSNAYLTWGHEDCDLQWKLEEKYSVRKVPSEDRFEVLHLDHKKGYFCPEQNKANMAIFSKRQEQGIDTAIKYDLMHQK